MDDMIYIDHVSKEYRLGAFGGATLKGDLQSWFARVRGKDDPNLKIGESSLKKNDRFLALEDVTFSVKPGEAVGIIGHNGAGKSTLLKLISRVTAPTKGDIYLNGRVASMLEVGTGFHPELTGRENVYLNGAILGMSKTEIDRKFDEIVEFSEISQFIDTPVKRYSSGMYVKLAFSVAAHLDSEIMIMDEVLAVGDMAFQKKSLGKMGEAADKQNRTVLYVSHNMGTVKRLCSKCAVLDRGHLIYLGDVDTAIGMYAGIRQNSSGSVFDLRNGKRCGDTHPIQGAKLTELRLIDKEDNNYRNGETMRMEISIDAEKTVPDVEVMMIVFYEDETRVGTTFSKKITIPEGKRKVLVDFDTSNIPEGMYYTEISINQVKENGAFIRHDSVEEAFSFIIKGEENKRWMNVWGRTSYPELTIIDVQ